MILDNPQKRKIITGAAIAGLCILLLVFLVPAIRNSSHPKELYIDSVNSPVSSQVKQIKMDRPYYNEKIRKKTIAFYKKTGNKTKWLEYNAPTRNYKAYLESIQHAADYGLNPEHYDMEDIEKDVEAIYENKDRKPEEVAALDIRITASFFLFTTHLIEGRIRTAGYGDRIWKRNLPKENDVDLLIENSSGNLAEIVEELHPKHEQYEKLRKALQEYRKYDTSFKIKLASSVKGAIKPGAKHRSIPEIRRRIGLTDMKPYEPKDSLLYDEKLVKAIKQFQTRHGLVADGIISSATMTKLNMSLQKKADLIELNLERLRWLPREYGGDYIAINIPEYMLRVYKNGKKDLEMKVVLGTEYNSTPIFSDTLEYIVFSPTWNIPASIMEEEFLPRLQNDPTTFDPERFVVYKNGERVDHEEIDWKDKDLNLEEYRMVENPGDMNSLGLVKFMMPNDFNIYLHDTPAEKLFKKNKRAYSHGCIRLEKPVDLAKYLLKDNEDKWDDEKIRDAMQGEEPKNVTLKKKFPVEIEYRTVWVDENGLVNFREDIYDHDQRQLAMLKKID